MAAPKGDQNAKGNSGVKSKRTYLDNLPNMDPDTVRRHERYRITKPEYLWQVIERLSPETARGRVYKGWRRVPEVPHNARLIGYGLDFGFDPDPAALVAVYYHDGGYIPEEKLTRPNFSTSSSPTKSRCSRKGSSLPTTPSRRASPNSQGTEFTSFRVTKARTA